MFIKALQKLPSLVALCGLTTLVACSGGSGQQNIQNDNFSRDDTDTGLVYKGPTPGTEDVLNFKLNVWDNLAVSDRCGACHNEVEGQEPMFVRLNDVNAAYTVANTLVDLSAPSLSRLATKVAEGHNCWSGEASVCADIISNYISAWATASGAASNVIVLTPPEIKAVGDSLSFPESPTEMGAGSFENTVYRLVTNEAKCNECHSEDSATKQQPYFASKDLGVAYDAARARMNLDEPEKSRFVVRLGEQFHNCWTNSCDNDAETMRQAIQAFTQNIVPTEVDPRLAISAAVGLPDGIIASSGGRIEPNVIALYEFKNDSLARAFDTSGVDPALDLNLIGDIERVGGWGIRINNGKAQASTSSSRKLYELIRTTGEYSLEAWVVPDNVAQDGPARIATYSGGSELRNFTLGQTLYNYDFMNRSTSTDANGMPFFSTEDDEEVLQATLQHVVANYDPINGSSIYVNGVLVATDDRSIGTNINDWDDTYAFAIGNEVDDLHLWKGTVRFLAIHNRVLSAEDIQANYDVGVGQKFYLLFSVSEYVNLPDSFVVFQVEQFDTYSYLFNKPFFISLSEQTPTEDITIQGIRIGVNGREGAVGQAFANVDASINASNYNGETGVPLSDLGAVIPLEKGTDLDVFFLSFDQIGSGSSLRDEPELPAGAEPTDLEAQPRFGLRNFEEIGATISRVTSVPLSGSNRDFYEGVYQQLPSDESAEGFLAAHQSGIMQLAIGFCNELSNNTSLRSAYYPSFNFSGSLDSSNIDTVLNPLLTALAANTVV